MNTIQKELVNKISSLLNGDNNIFRSGYLFYEGFSKIGDLDQFKFVSTDPNNKFGLIENDYIPTYFTGFAGTIAPINNLYDESGTLLIQFAIPVTENYNENYSLVENFKITISGYSNEMTVNDTIYNYVLNGSPLTPGQSPISLNGIRVVMVDMTVYYRVSNNCRFGNGRKYFIRQYAIDFSDITSQPDITESEKEALIEEVEGYDIAETVKSLILSDIENDIELSNTYKEMISNYRIESKYVELIRTGNSVNIGDVVNASQQILQNEITNIGGSRVYSADMTIYTQNNFFNDVLEQIENGEDQDYTVFVLRKVENGVVKERNVILENLSVSDDIGIPIFKSIKFRQADNLIIEKEMIDKGLV